MNEMLDDTETYMAINYDKLEKVINEVHNDLYDFLMCRQIDHELYLYFLIEHPHIPYIKGLPKIHKNTFPLPMRLIVVGNGWVTETISLFLEKKLSPLIQGIPSILKDTCQLLDTLNNSFSNGLPDTCVLVTLDVKNLFTSIPNNYGLEAIRQTLNDSINFTTDEQILFSALLDMVLSNNVFTFDNRLYLQRWGVAMGTPCANTYANLVVHHWEKSFLFNSLHFTKILLYKRFVDDILLFWNGTPDELTIFIQYLESTTEFFRFTMEYSYVNINFLDITIIKDARVFLSTSLYRKSCWKNTLLHFNSMHLRFIFRNIIKSQFTRLTRLCQDPLKLHEQGDLLEDLFLERGYNPEMVRASKNSILNDTLEASQFNFRRYKRFHRATNESKVTFITRFISDNKAIVKVISANWHILTIDTDIKKITGIRLIFTYKNSKNLKRLLCIESNHPEVRPPRSLNKLGTYPCGKCNMC
ncbi:uncharacterized protein LOC122816675 [Protopterus annectens]|uniref:uncharacterized protein LOC122816675 n=1 Tax=Protopterus annectens TaxID=7888 RepID=UPI001CF9BB98|nr:uncharacterized protein LOC122816675 [Protopterus annectens]